MEQNTEDQNSQENLEERLIELEAKLIEQEHRFFTSLKNFQKYERGDKRRKAAILALAYNFLFSSPGIAIGSTLIAIATILILVLQTGIMREQNQEIVSQNKLIQEQIDIQQNQIYEARRTELIAILYDSNNSIYLSRLKSEALAEYIHLEMQKTPAKKINLKHANLQGIILSDVDWKNLDFEGANFKGAELTKCTLNGFLEDVNFDDARLNCVQFGPNLANSSFVGADLKNCVFDDCVMHHVDFEDANLSHCSFMDVSYDNPIHSSRIGINIHNAKLNEPEGFTVKDFCMSYGIPDDFRLADTHFISKIKDSCGLERRIYTDQDSIVLKNISSELIQQIFEPVLKGSITFQSE